VLFGYNWNQVSIKRPPKGGADGDGGGAGGVRAQIRKLSSLMLEFGHSWVDVLKIDIEGI
jgi:hypothetical protein